MQIEWHTEDKICMCEEMVGRIAWDARKYLKMQKKLSSFTTLKFISNLCTIKQAHWATPGSKLQEKPASKGGSNSYFSDKVGYFLKQKSQLWGLLRHGHSNDLMLVKLSFKTFLEVISKEYKYATICKKLSFDILAIHPPKL